MKQLPARSRAYDLYIRGKVKAGSENADDNEGAIKAPEAAVAIDPFFAEAHAQLARAYNTRAFKFSSHAQGKELRENDLAEAHFAFSRLAPLRKGMVVALPPVALGRAP